ncbi:dienelactone hydrolase family protein [Synechococcus sp. A10-1-5-1]|uniref:alpha/beta hydrolase n=1 Tax=Synechococcus sp. A10-1-5-1 TaxID=2936507 RepID=UPI00200191D4|nr:dienelactone hydrolase family protein [Synechococcus sp. A10-1-5-1]UPM49137.1 dienelactone hydrolase family protein [Synechococcus sp. A10-1-5-1]
MTSRPDQLQLGPEPAQQRLVLLHGWGADADDLLDLGELLVSPQTSVVALRAPEPHPYGTGRQWYGLQPIDWDALPAARSSLQARLLALGESVPLERTVLLGFSQGAAMALDVGTTLPLAGIAACSGYPHQGWEPPSCCPPVLLTHGRQDPVVPFLASEELQQQLQASGQTARLLPFEGGHGIDESVLPELKGFIAEQIEQGPIQP